MTKANDEYDVYRIVFNKIKLLIPDGITAVSILNEEQSFIKTIAISGFDRFFDIIQNTFGLNPYKMTYPLNEMNEEERELLLSAKLENSRGVCIRFC